MPKINRTYCSVFGCITNNIQNPNYSFFSIPSNEKLRMQWLQLIQRLDLADGRYRSHRVCEEHFWPADILVKATKRLLKRNVVPSLRLPDSLDDNEPAEIIQEIKQEIQDSISVYEEDLLETINRKRQGDTDPLAECKRIKVEHQEHTVTAADTSPKSEYSEITEAPEPKVMLEGINPEVIKRDGKKTKRKSAIIEDVPHPSTADLLTVGFNRENDIFPVDFMKSVLNSQNEILTVLKSQVLLENPDPDLLTFLRFVGAKLSRLKPVKRKEMQNMIIDFLNKD